MSSDTVLILNNVGLGLQFAAVAPPIYERARALGKKSTFTFTLSIATALGEVVSSTSESARTQ